MKIACVNIPELPAHSVAALKATLREFSPRIAPATEFAGILDNDNRSRDHRHRHNNNHNHNDKQWSRSFWLDPCGMEALFGSLCGWAKKLVAALVSGGHRATVVLGFQRYATFMLARGNHEPLLLTGSRQHERELLAKVPLSHTQAELPELSNVIDELGLLGLHTVGDLLDLPAAELRLRYGDELFNLRQLAAGDTELPLQPEKTRSPPWHEMQLEPPASLLAAIIAALEQCLQRVIGITTARAELISVLAITLSLDIKKNRHHQHQKTSIYHTEITPSLPTVDAAQLMELLHLRLDHVSLVAPVHTVRLRAHTERPRPRQLVLDGNAADSCTANRVVPKRERSRHDNPFSDVANTALAAIKARFGNDAVSFPVLRAAILPEAQFYWSDDFFSSSLSQHSPASVATLVRRVFRNPLRGAPVARLIADANLMFGPYRIQGGWWGRGATRDYYYATSPSGALLWLYRDHQNNDWVLHGVVD